MCPWTLAPLVLARPSGWRVDFEFRSRRAVSHALAARTMILARTSWVLPVAVSTYATAVARPSSFVSTSRAMAPVRILRRPVASAGGRRTDGLEKFERVLHPRPHWPQ